MGIRGCHARHAVLLQQLKAPIKDVFWSAGVYEDTDGVTIMTDIAYGSEKYGTILSSEIIDGKWKGHDVTHMFGYFMDLGCHSRPVNNEA